ncbi:MAG TPA: serine/threonine-protein kinase [Polyangiaceae bacterium]|jgi:serine/threonine-protein kinase|nr:serine/threonine-protein kinase [Polyangiaceae bacterium]
MADDSSKDDRSPLPPGSVSATPPPVPSEGLPAGPSSPPDPLLGKVLLDRVRIVRAIARGGMGKVYVGEQTRLKRRVAVKVLDPRLTSGPDAVEFTRRFLLEASIASKLTHPHVVTIFDYGETPDGCFIAMEYLEGRSLADELAQRGPLSAERAVHVTVQIARALREAHALGVVHRDVKPGNVFLLRQDDDDDFVKVLDFGLVHERQASDSREAAGADAIMGSPRYMAPEQVQGKEIDGRADIYSLGIVLYAMLTGRPPFERRTELATMMAQVSDPPPPMPSVAPGLVLPGGLEAIVMRCLAKSPDDRWASMEELVAALHLQTMPSVFGSGPPRGAVRDAPSAIAPGSLGASPGASMAAPTVAVGLPRRPGGAGRAIGTAALVAAVAALVAVALRDRPAPASASPSRGATAPAVSSVAAAAPVATAVLHVETDPPGAKVNEEGETLCAATPCDIVYSGEAADPSADHLLAFLLPGYKLERKIAKTTSPVKVKLSKAAP